MSIRTTYTKKLEDGRIALRMAAVQIHGEYLIGEAIEIMLNLTTQHKPGVLQRLVV